MSSGLWVGFRAFDSRRGARGLLEDWLRYVDDGCGDSIVLHSRQHVCSFVCIPALFRLMD